MGDMSFTTQNTTTSPKLILTFLSLILAVCFWGGSFPATKLVLKGFSPMSYIFFRFFGASLIFGLLLLLKPRRIGRANHLRLMGMALFHPTLYFIFESIGMQYTSASSASLIIAAIPAMVALLAGFVLKEKLSRLEWIGVLLSVSGALLLAGFDDNAAYADSSLLGNLLVVAAAVTATIYLVMARYLAGRVTSLEMTAYQVIYGTLYLLPIFLIRIQANELTAVGFSSVGALIFLIFGATVLAFFFYNRALSKIDASKAAVFLNGVPIVSVTVSALLLGEQLGTIQLIGGGVVIAGVTMANLKPPRFRTTLKG
jgi:drug/metabolite transporter (DMT)-like permease